MQGRHFLVSTDEINIRALPYQNFNASQPVLVRFFVDSSFNSAVALNATVHQRGVLMFVEVVDIQMNTVLVPFLNYPV